MNKMIKHKRKFSGTRKYAATSKTSRINMAIDRRKIARPRFLAKEKN